MSGLANELVANAEKDNPSHQTLAHQLGQEQAFNEVIQMIDERIAELCYDEYILAVEELERLKKQILEEI